MPDILGAAKPVQAYDKAINSRNTPISPESTRVQNSPVPGVGIQAPQRHSQGQESNLGNGGGIYYESNFKSFLDRLENTPFLSEETAGLFADAAMQAELPQLASPLQADLEQALSLMEGDDRLLELLMEQVNNGSLFAGSFFNVLREALEKDNAAFLKKDVLNFLKCWMDHSAQGHIENSIRQDLDRLAQSLPQSWGQKLQELARVVDKNMAAGNRSGALQLLEGSLMPFLHRYFSLSHQTGTPRMYLSMLVLNIARYENSSLEKLNESFTRMMSYSGLKHSLGGITLEQLLQQFSPAQKGEGSRLSGLSQALGSAAEQVMNGDGSPELLQLLRRFTASALVNESVYMPINHYVLPLQYKGTAHMAELWVDPDSEQESKGGKAKKPACKLYFKMELAPLGSLDMIVTAAENRVAVNLFCPEEVMPFSRQIQTALTDILKNNQLEAASITVKKADHRLSLREIFPKIDQWRNSVDVRI